MPLSKPSGWMSKFSAGVLSAIFILGLFFQCPKSFANDRIGLVMLHGKVGLRPSVQNFARAMSRAGALTATPLMPYPEYNASFAQALDRIDAAVAALKRRGARVVAVGGVSMGANTALGYAARRKGVIAVLAFAPGHVPDLEGFQRRVEHSYRKAKTMIDAGRGIEFATFKDNNQGAVRSVRTTAANYYSWFNPKGQAVMPRSVANLSKDTALLWVVGTKDRMFRRGKKYAFSLAPSNPQNRYLVVSAGHKDTIYAGGLKACNWLGALASTKLGTGGLNCGGAFKTFRRKSKGRCRTGDMAACRRACARGKQAACRRLKRIQ